MAKYANNKRSTRYVKITVIRNEIFSTSACKFITSDELSWKDYIYAKLEDLQFMSLADVVDVRFCSPAEYYKWFRQIPRA